ncbi:hypothetical protein [Arthrobacter sp. UM1]|uniref:hypothetical protein n=1 Tax=Arthrobacter sp. UM1 TaxID=2766776 RepID=UPI001CF65149|nr:hypothetical protein [Arthrobacter sp. UM1]MCB4208421.1 hypothetical protein [Arthrobacter sp. UM1]MCB4208422.1 hypothetical protein [Arthrobacter sp. UM1]
MFALNLPEVLALLVWAIGVGFMAHRFAQARNGWNLAALVVAVLVPLAGAAAAVVVGCRRAIRAVRAARDDANRTVAPR